MTKKYTTAMCYFYALHSQSLLNTALSNQGDTQYLAKHNTQNKYLIPPCLQKTPAIAQSIVAVLQEDSLLQNTMIQLRIPSMIQLIPYWQIIKPCQAQPIKGEEELGHRRHHHDRD